MVGVVFNVQSTSAACAEKVVFGAKWTTLWARFCDAGRVPSGLVGMVGVVGARGGWQLVRTLLSRAVAASSCPVAAFGLVVWGNYYHRGATRRRHAVTGGSMVVKPPPLRCFGEGQILGVVATYAMP